MGQKPRYKAVCIRHRTSPTFLRPSRYNQVVFSVFATLPDDQQIECDVYKAAFISGGGLYT